MQTVVSLVSMSKQKPAACGRPESTAAFIQSNQDLAVRGSNLGAGRGAKP